MPVGVPKVAYPLEEDQPSEWMDLYNCLFRERYLYLFQDLEEELANQLIAILTYLNLQEDMVDEDILLFINSMGGSMICGLALFDTMGFVDSDVNTICMGMAASMATFVLMGGKLGKRTALSNCKIMLHQPSGGGEAENEATAMDIHEMVRIREQVVQVYCQRTGKSADTIKEDLNRDDYLSPHQAKEYKLVDQVGIDADFLPLKPRKRINLDPPPPDNYFTAMMENE